MSLWLRVRHARACSLTVFAVALALFLVGNLSLPIPNLLGGPQFGVPLALLLPVAVGVVVAWGLTAGDPLVETVASRPLLLLDGAYALGIAFLALASCTLAQAVGGSELALAAGRNALAYIGLTLLGRRLLGSHAAAVLPASVVLVTALFGRGSAGQPRWWAWPLAAADNPLPWGVAVVLLIAGVLTALLRTDATAAER